MKTRSQTRKEPQKHWSKHERGRVSNAPTISFWAPKKFQPRCVTEISFPTESVNGRATYGKIKFRFEGTFSAEDTFSILNVTAKFVEAKKQLLSAIRTNEEHKSNCDRHSRFSSVSWNSIFTYLGFSSPSLDVKSTATYFNVSGVKSGSFGSADHQELFKKFIFEATFSNNAYSVLRVMSDIEDQRMQLCKLHMQLLYLSRPTITFPSISHGRASHRRRL